METEDRGTFLKKLATLAGIGILTKIDLFLGETSSPIIAKAKATGACSYGSDCADGGGKCSYGSSCRGQGSGGQLRLFVCQCS